jgi:D-alanyl-D-alanine carboxypeptidase
MITAQDSAPSSAPGHDPQRIAALATAGLALCEEMRAPGATLAAVLQDGSLIRTAVGFDNVFTHTPMTADRRMLGGSTGKSFVAATALALAAEGLVDLDAPVERWLGDTAVFAHLPNAKNLTLRLLLQHSGGLPDHMGSPGLMPKLLERFEREGPDSYLAPIEALELVADLAPINRAGHGFFYSDTGFILAGITLEIATGRTLYELVRRHVLDRLGLTNTEPAISRHLDRLATAHLVTADAVVPNLA